MRKVLPRTAIPLSRKEVVATLRGLLPEKSDAREDVAKFENDLATYLGAKKTLACDSGRTAFYIALQALNLKPAEEVIVPAYVCAIVFEVILRLGLKPVLVDVDMETFNINPELIPKALTEKTRVIVPVHLFGRPSEMDWIAEIAVDHGLYLIEDCAQALGAEYKGAKVGTFGNLAFFSFGPGKSITSGEGGAIAVNNKELMEKVESAHGRLTSPSFEWAVHLVKNVMAMKIFADPRIYGFIRGRLEDVFDEREAKTLENCRRLGKKKDVPYLHPTIRLAKMPPFSARVARTQLQKIDEFNDKRIDNAKTLTKLLSETRDFIQYPRTEEYAKSTFTRYPVRILKGSRDAIWRKMIEQGVDSERPYHYLADYLRSSETNTPHAVLLAKSTLTIPNHPLLKKKEILKTANVLKAALSESQ